MVAEGTFPSSFPRSSMGRFEVTTVDRSSCRRMTTLKRNSPPFLGSCFRPNVVDKQELRLQLVRERPVRRRRPTSPRHDQEAGAQALR